MPVDYFSDWTLPDLDPSDAVAARATLTASFAEVELDVPMAELSADDLAALPGHVLFGFSYDDDMTTHLFAIPEADLSAELRTAMETANRCGYSYHELMIGDDEAKAFLRLDAAFDADGIEEILEEVEEETPGFAAQIADSDRACLTRYRIGGLENGKDPDVPAGGLDKRFVAAYSVRRGQ